MPVFFYKAKNKNGENISGRIEAVSAEAVAGLIAEKKWIVVDISGVSGVFGRFDFIFKRVRKKDLTVFFRQLSVMIRSNLPIVKALQILVKQTENPKLKEVIIGLAGEVDGGAKLSVAMAAYPHVFGDFVSSVVGSGETSGRLSEVVDYLADQQEKDYDLESKIKGSLSYPAFIIFGMLAVGLVVMNWSVPQMTKMLSEAGVALPLTTRFLIGFSHLTANFWWLILLILALLFFAGGWLVKKTMVGRRFFDAWKIRIPVFGGILRRVYIVRIFRSLNTLLKGGVPVSQSLRVAQNVAGNEVFRRIIAQAIKEVDDGNGLSESLAPHKEIPIMVSQMISVGEETGRLEEIMEKMTAFYSKEIDTSVANLSSLIEPAIMVILGVAVGFFVAAIIMPMWQLSSVF